VAPADGLQLTGSTAPAPAAPARPSVEEAALYLAGRSGRILHQGRILKPNHFPRIHQESLQQGRSPQPLVAGAPNFRRVGRQRIYGVGQPTVEGLKEVLARLDAAPGGKGRVVWTNMREEPVLYINGRPHSAHDLESPNVNLESPGLSPRQVEAQEERLKAEVLAEAARHGGRLLLHDQMPDGSHAPRWERVESVRTVKEVYRDLQEQGWRVDYARIPVSDEKSPEPQDFDALLRRLQGAPPEAHLVFNCHMGRGRTTTAMVVADLWRRARGGEPRVRPRVQTFSRQPAVHQDIREQGRRQRSQYRIILSLIQALEQGPRSKQEADSVIDRFACLQNLRRAVDEHYRAAAAADCPDRARHLRQRAGHFLHRYFHLIALDAYLKEQARGGTSGTFAEWLLRHPDLSEMVGYLHWSLGLPAPGGR
jgi:predicted protein tyrosine phosphatase